MRILKRKGNVKQVIPGFGLSFGVVTAMLGVIVVIPFVVGVCSPCWQKVEEQYEEAASLLGASRIQIFFGVIFPEIRPALIAGFTMAFARSIGEYGSVVFIAGNTPYKTEIAPLMIMAKLQEYDYASATSIALVMLVLPLVYVIVTALRNGLGAHLAAVTEPYAVKAILLTIQVTVIAVVVNTVFGLFASWLITKFQFHGKKIFPH